MAARPASTGFAWFGVALNGIPFEPVAQEFYNDDRNAGWRYEAIGGESDLGIDLTCYAAIGSGRRSTVALP